MLAELERKAAEIKGSGDFLTAYSLEAGLTMYPKHYVGDNPKRLEAYRVGLDIAILKDYCRIHGVRAEQFTGDISLQQGFFDRYQIVPEVLTIKQSELKENTWSRVQFMRTLEQLRRLRLAGIAEGEYKKYIRGALLVVNYWQEWLQRFVSPESVLVESHDRQGQSGQISQDEDGLLQLSEKFYNRAKSDLLVINQEKEDLLTRLKGLDPTLSPEELSRLKFAKWLVDNGKVRESL